MNTLQIIRGGNRYELNWQITPEGRFQFFVNELDTTLGGQPVRTPIRKLIIEFDEEGWDTGIHTHYTRYALDNEGSVIDRNGSSKYCQPLPMTANILDRKNIVLGFAGALFPSIANGLIRSGYGFNYLPPFNSATGEVLTYTPEQEQQQPTNDYYTHHSDGTPIA